MSENEKVSSPPSEPREPRRELEWHEEMPGLWRGYLLADDGTSLVRCEVQKFFEGRTFPQWSASVSKRCVDLFAGREICETLTRVLDGEPREPEICERCGKTVPLEAFHECQTMKFPLPCPTNHSYKVPHSDQSGDEWTYTWHKHDSPFCRDCGASLKGTE